jgi:hypothetical protein
MRLIKWTLAAVCLFSTAALALPSSGLIYLKRQSPLFQNGSAGSTGANPSSATAGIFSLQWSLTSNGTFTNFNAICIDANEFLFSGTQAFIVETLDNYTTIPTPSGVNAPLTDSSAADRKKLLEQLFTVGWADATSGVNNTKSAAFQWAGWEIGKENLSNGLNLRSDASNRGNVYTNSNTIADQGNTYLNAINSNTARTKLLILTPVQMNTQGQWVRMSGQELLTPNVPEPGFMALLSVGMLGMGYVVARKRRAGQPVA